MKHLFIILLLAFFVTIALFFGVLSASFLFGYHRSTRDWVNERRKALEVLLSDKLKKILPESGRRDGADMSGLLETELGQALPSGVFLEVYNRDRELIYRHTASPGKRKRREEEDQHPGTHLSTRSVVSSMPLSPVELDGKIIGYYRIGSVSFGIDRANRIFILRMQKSVLLGSAAAFALALLLSFLLSKRISGPARRVAAGIDRITQGDLSHIIPEKGASEIVEIAVSANKLSSTLRREEQLRQQWTADVAHDLRTPITALKAQLEGMADGVLDLTAERIGMNMRELKRIESLVDNLAELTRLESPRMRIAPSRLNTKAFFRELENRFAPFFRKKTLSVKWRAEEPAFTGDEDLLLRALSNLLSNAVRHTPRGGSLEVTARREADRIILSVHNTGPGIPKNEIDRVFDRLYRGEKARRSFGSGLGLTIAKKIAELHGGTVTIQSGDGTGTTVHLLIPV